MSDEQQLQASGGDALQADQVPEFAVVATDDAIQIDDFDAPLAIQSDVTDLEIEAFVIEETLIEVPEPAAPLETPTPARRPTTSPKKPKRKKAKAAKARPAKSKKAKAKAKRKTVKRAKPAKKSTKRKKVTRTKKSAKRVKRPAKRLKKPAKRVKKTAKRKKKVQRRR